MGIFSLLPQRCVCCGGPAAEGLCRLCQARRQKREAFAATGHCPLCGAVLLGERFRCADCAAREWPFVSLDGLFGYQEAGGELVRLYKFQGAAGLAAEWARSVAARVDPPGPLVPVPPSRRSLWRRGWDPVETWTRALARELDQPVWKVLVRRPSAAQKSLDREAREANARRAYGLFKRQVAHRTVWLIDDVVTTGATAEACSRLLLEAGAAEVRVLCLGLH